MAKYDYSDRDLEAAAEFREGIHKEALQKVRAILPGADTVIDRNPVETYFQNVWEYPGKWYLYVAIPEGFRSRAALIDSIVNDTLEFYRRKSAVSDQSDPESVDLEDKAEPQWPDDRQTDEGMIIYGDPFYSVITDYPECVVEYCLVKNDHSATGIDAHRRALARACAFLFSDAAGDALWHYDVAKADAREIPTAALFASADLHSELNYRKAFLFPPHKTGYNNTDFEWVNVSLFPKGTAALEVFQWSTDWSDFFDDGHEWWGALCLTVYDKNTDRFVVIMASETD
jgi:hypothetical protein